MIFIVFRVFIPARVVIIAQGSLPYAFNSNVLKMDSQIPVLYTQKNGSHNAILVAKTQNVNLLAHVCLDTCGFDTLLRCKPATHKGCHYILQHVVTPLVGGRFAWQIRISGTWARIVLC
jgi:hypothetical protein